MYETDWDVGRGAWIRANVIMITFVVLVFIQEYRLRSRFGDDPTCVHRLNHESNDWL